jgi:dihydroxy-acid dehydratase
MSEEKPAGIDGNLTTYGDPYFSRFIRRAFMASQGFDKEDLDRPIIGIADTSSDYNTCHANMPQMVSAVKRGVLEAGGLPLVFPTISLNEILFHPTTMFYRNLLAMDTEEMIRAQPMDAVVLLGGCDKTVPAQLMAAASANVPAVFCVTGAMRTGDWRGNRVGACTDCRRYYTSFRGGEISEPELEEVQQVLCSTPGTCMVMGSASTIACVTETLGLMLPGGASPTSGSGDRLRNAVASGRTAVDLARNPIRPTDILTRPAFDNALKVLVALGGSRTQSST